jgi:Arc/MetJ-type ribon-helix-helix transcriptional regulator
MTMNSPIIAARIPQEIMEWVDSQAKSLSMDRSEFVRSLLSDISQVPYDQQAYGKRLKHRRLTHE